MNQRMTENLFNATPVDTGFARTNWIPSIGAPVTDTFGQRSVGLVSDSAQTSGKASLNSYQLSQGNLYVANNVPYIKTLNAGSSLQAPSAFVDTAVEQALIEFEGRVI